MASSPNISIIIPAYNAERFLVQTLSSILAQTRGDWECIIADDGSNDATCSIANEWASVDPRFRLVSGPNGGQSVARNRGLAATSPHSSFVSFVDADDELIPDALSYLVQAIDPAHVGAFGLASLIDDEGKSLGDGSFVDYTSQRCFVRDGRVRFQHSTEPSQFEDIAVASKMFPPAIALCRRDAVLAVGGFDGCLRRASEWDLFIRIAARGTLAFVDRIVARYRRHEANLSAVESRGMWLAERYIRWKTYHAFGRCRMAPLYRAWNDAKIREAGAALMNSLKHRRPSRMVRETLRCGLYGGLWAMGWPCLPVSRRRLIREKVLNRA